jgi:hypothetical protein
MSEKLVWYEFTVEYPDGRINYAPIVEYPNGARYLDARNESIDINEVTSICTIRNLNQIRHNSHDVKMYPAYGSKIWLAGGYEEEEAEIEYNNEQLNFPM